MGRISLIIGITGPMAAGKNRVSDILEKKGFACVDADMLAHQAVTNKTNQILATFSNEAAVKHIELKNKNGSLNRRALGKLIFPEPKLLAQQEAIVHPEINKLLEEFIQEHSKQDIILNATVLYKVDIIKKCTAIIYVYAPIFIRFFRAKKRDSMKICQIFSRFKAQKELFAKYKNLTADIYKVWNIGKSNYLEKRITLIIEKYRQRGL